MNNKMLACIAVLTVSTALFLTSSPALASCNLGGLKENGSWGANLFSDGKPLTTATITVSCKEVATISNCRTDDSRRCYSNLWDQMFGSGRPCGEQICATSTTTIDVVKGKFSNETFSFSPYKFTTKNLTGIYYPETRKIFFLEEGQSYTANTNKLVKVDRGFWVYEKNGKLMLLVEIYKPGTRELYTSRKLSENLSPVQ